MPEPPRPLLHLLRGLEELLRAGAETAASWRARVEAEQPGSLEQGLQQLGGVLAAFGVSPEDDLMEALREALRAESARWEQRATVDPAARRVRDLCQALLDALGEDEGRSSAGSSRPRRAPRRPRASS